MRNIKLFLVTIFAATQCLSVAFAGSSPVFETYMLQKRSGSDKFYVIAHPSYHSIVELCALSSRVPVEIQIESRVLGTIKAKGNADSACAAIEIKGGQKLYVRIDKSLSASDEVEVAFQVFRKLR